ncbi:MAG: hypothetical protein ACPLPR_03325 [Bacillota bacterium]
MPLEVAQRALEAQGLHVVSVRVLKSYGEHGSGQGELIVVSQRPAGEGCVELWCCQRPLGPEGIVTG